MSDEKVVVPGVGNLTTDEAVTQCSDDPLLVHGRGALEALTKCVMTHRMSCKGHDIWLRGQQAS